MQKLPIYLAKPGMILARAVAKDNGMALCAEGTELTAALIERLMQMNVTRLTVMGRPVDTGEQPKPVEDRIRDMEGRFDRVRDDPLMMRIMDAVSRAMLDQDREDREIEEQEKAVPHE